MKKIITLFLTLVFIFMMIPAMNSCTPEDKANVVHFLRPGVNSKTDGSFYGNVCLEFEKQTKQTVKLVSSTWDTITEKLTVQAAAGKPVEVFFTGGGAIVWYANKGYAQALNKYVDLQSPAIDLEVMEDQYRVDGKHYYVTQSTHFWTIFYNKEMFEAKGAEDPYELYKSDRWNYDTFYDLVKLFAHDEDQDGTYDIYGLSGTTTEMFLYANHANFCKKDQNGKFSIDFGSQNLINGLEFVRKLWSEGFYLESGLNTEWVNGQTAMYLERQFMAGLFDSMLANGTLEFDYGFVPLPYGPQNTEKLNVSYTDGYCLGAKCKNPYGGGKFIDILMKMGAESSQKEQKTFRPQTLEMFEELRKKHFAWEAADEGLFESDIDIKWAVLTDMQQSSVASALEKYKQKAIASCEGMNKFAVLPIARPFEDFIYDFDDGNLNFIKTEQTGVSVEVVDSQTIKQENVVNDVVFNGKSVKLTFNNAGADGQVEILRTDVNVDNIAGWRNYDLFFDYKFLEEITGTIRYKIVSEDGLVFCETIVPNDKTGFVTNYWNQLKKVDTNAEKLAFVITVEKATGVMVIDNFAITEDNNLIDE